MFRCVLCVLPDSATAADPLSRCQAAHLTAAGQLCRLAARCARRSVRHPDRDPDGDRRDECVGRARRRFERAYDLARIRARRAGDRCSLDAPAASVAEDQTGEMEALFDQILAGHDASDPADNRLRSALVGAVGRQCRRDLSAESAHVRRPDPIYKRDLR